MQINKEIIYQNLLLLLEHIFRLPDISHVCIRKQIILSPDRTEQIRSCVDASYHDIFSDIDLKAYLTDRRAVTPAELGLTRENCLGLTRSEDANDSGAFQTFRIALKNGIRYDIVFYERKDSTAAAETMPAVTDSAGSQPVWTQVSWPLEKADSFWFIAVQALGKLYRRDHLIADHLTNMLINESLVAQMVDRDNRCGTNIHRYGYAEELEYRRTTREARPYGRLPGQHPETFYWIADKLYAAAAAYDRLIPALNPEYEERRSWFYELWQTYEEEGESPWIGEK